MKEKTLFRAASDGCILITDRLAQLLYGDYGDLIMRLTRVLHGLRFSLAMEMATGYEYAALLPTMTI